MADGLKNAKVPLTRDTVIKGMEAIGDVDLGGFRVRFGPNQHNGSTLIELVSDK
jgi:branched-chain amino acid transport system substrate-binding protein